MTGAFEAIVLIVFLVTGSGVPQGGFEGPFVLPGFHTMKDCRDVTAEKSASWRTREAKEHGVAESDVEVFSACRASGTGA